MNSVSPSTGLIHLGLDTSKNAIAVGILRSDEVFRMWRRFQR